MQVPEFDDTLITGYALIDEQHRWLFALAARVARTMGVCDVDEAAWPEDERPDACDARVDDAATDAVYGLLDYVAEHFSDEEGLMREANYPLATVHASLHTDLNERLAPFVIAEVNDGTVDAEKLVVFFTEWLRSHILRHDVEFAAWLAARPAAS